LSRALSEKTFEKTNLEELRRIKIGEIILTEVSRPLKYKETEEHRNLDCPRYFKCHTYAIEKNFISFSCINCPFQKERESPFLSFKK
jgi:hypothetical protein